MQELDKKLFPARFQLIAAMNPCPCGFYGDLTRTCKCTSEMRNKYQNKISGPLLDRIDLHVTISRENISLQEKERKPLNHIYIQKVKVAREIQYQRQGFTNNLLSIHDIYKYCNISEKDNKF